MQWVTLVVALGCARLSQASRGPTPTPTSTHTPLVDNSEEEVDEPCFEPCTCEVKEGVLHVHCDGRGFTNASQVSQSWIRPFKLNLQRNSFRRLYSNGFQHLGNAVSMNLGNNALQDIRVGAFNGLAKLKRLYLHENKLEVFRNDTFAGLEALEYLQADYNVIKRIDSGALRFLYKLRVLILNDNLIPVLPAHLFRSVSLTHLDLRGNRLKSLAKDGTLQYIGRSLMELQLEENPWNCSCEAVELLQWLGQIPYTAVVGDVTCEYPFHLHGKDLREIPRKELCADLPDKEHQGERGAPSAGSQPQPLPPNSKHNSHPGRARPTRPSSMVHGSRQNTLASSTSSPYTSAERKEREKQLKPTKRPRSSNRTPPTARSLMPNQNPPVAGYQTRPPIPIICPIRCTCNLHIADLGQTLNCKENGFRNMSQLIPRPLNGRKLFLGGNFIQKLVRSDFWNFSSLDLIHFGNNRISFIQEGAFSSLVNLRTLHLNENELDRLSPHMFLGLQNLRFLYLENNKIGVVDPGTFDSMPSLELLFLNYNALRSLPVGVFYGVKLSRLNLRNNVFQHLPVEGVLEHLRGLVQVDLQQNPWECNCEAAALKRWLEGLSTMILMGEAVCKSPEKTQGVALRSLSMELLCPELEPQEARELEEQMANSTDAGGNVSVYPTPGLGPLAPPWIDSIPLSVLVLSLLVLFVSAFFAAAALIAYALRVREKLPFRRQGEVDLAGIQMECGIFTEQTHHHHHHHLHHDLPEKPPLALAEHNHVYDTILPREAAAKGADPAASHMCSNPMFKDQQDVDVNQQLQQQQQAQQQQQQAFAASKECKGGYCPTPEKEKEWTLEVSSSPINTITGAMGALAGLHGNGILCPTVIDSQGPTPKVELVDCLFQLPTPEFRDLPDRYGRPPPCYPRTQDSKQEVRPDQTLVVTTARSSAGGGHGGQSEQGDGEQRPRLRTKPDYMEVLDRSYQF